MQEEITDNVCKEAVFERIYSAHSNDLQNFLHYKYGERCGPADKMQEAFIKLWDNCKKVTVSKAKSFLFTVANNMMLNEIKHQKVVLNYHQVAPKNHTNETPEFILEQEEYLNQYKKVLESLSEEQRVAFLLNKVEGKKHAEIAEMLGITKKVVEYRIYSAFKVLKSELENFKIK